MWTFGNSPYHLHKGVPSWKNPKGMVNSHPWNGNICNFTLSYVLCRLPLHELWASSGRCGKKENNRRWSLAKKDVSHRIRRVIMVRTPGNHHFFVKAAILENIAPWLVVCFSFGPKGPTSEASSLHGLCVDTVVSSTWGSGPRGRFFFRPGKLGLWMGSKGDGINGLFHLPGDSKWPFHPLIGGHLTFERFT